MYLTAEQEQIIRTAWADGATAAECAILAGIPVGRIRQRLADQLADLPRRGRGAGAQRRTALPSTEEIAHEAAIIRQRWSADRWLGMTAG